MVEGGQIRSKIEIKRTDHTNGKKSFRVVPYADIEEKRYVGRSSNKAKPKPNVARFSKSDYYKDRSDAMCPFFIKTISLKGKTYTITGYVVNKRRLKLEKYHRLKIRVLSCGKSIFNRSRYTSGSDFLFDSCAV